MVEKTMTATSVLFFGRLSDLFGARREIDMPAEGCSVAELKKRLAAAMPEFAEAKVLAAVDQQMVGDDASVRPGQEVAFFSPLSGG